MDHGGSTGARTQDLRGVKQTCSPLHHGTASRKFNFRITCAEEVRLLTSSCPPGILRPLSVLTHFSGTRALHFHRCHRTLQRATGGGISQGARKSHPLLAPWGVDGSPSSRPPTSRRSVDGLQHFGESETCRLRGQQRPVDVRASPELRLLPHAAHARTPRSNGAELSFLLFLPVF